MFAISLFSIAYAGISFLLAYLAVYVTLHPPDERKKAIRKRQFIFLGILGMAVVAGQEIKGYVDRKHEQETAASVRREQVGAQAALIKRTEDVNASLARLETLWTAQCSSLSQRSSIAQECLDEIRKLRSEFTHSFSQVRGSVNQMPDPSVNAQTAFLRGRMPDIQLPNPFSRPLQGLGTELMPAEPKHFSVPLVETISVSDRIGVSSGGPGCVNQYGESGGNCMTEECTVPCSSGSTSMN
jgi:hypothetical protein